MHLNTVHQYAIWQAPTTTNKAGKVDFHRYLLNLNFIYSENYVIADILINSEL